MYKFMTIRFEDHFILKLQSFLNKNGKFDYYI